MKEHLIPSISKLLEENVSRGSMQSISYNVSAHLEEEPDVSFENVPNFRQSKAKLLEFDKQDLRRRSMLALDNQKLLDIEQRKFNQINLLLNEVDDKTEISETLPNISVKYDKNDNLSTSDVSYKPHLLP